MSICVHCGVELDPGFMVCPLCGKNPETGEEETADHASHPSAILKIHKRENKKTIWELSGILAFSGVAICLIVDLLTAKGIQWAHFTSVNILMAWVILTLLLLCRNRPLLLLAGVTSGILAMLLSVDLFTGGMSWFLPVGLPITAAAFLAAGILILFYRFTPMKGLNLIGAGMLLIAGFCIVTETILDLFITGRTGLQWSLITAISIFPVAMILFFYHYRLKRGRRLDTIFHV